MSRWILGAHRKKQKVVVHQGTRENYTTLCGFGILPWEDCRTNKAVTCKHCLKRRGKRKGPL